LALTIAAGVLRQGHVVNFVAVSEPPDEVRRALQSEVPNLTELEKNKKFWLYDWHTWMTGKKSDDPFAVDSLSVAKLSADVPIFWRDYSPIFDFAIVDKRIDDTQV